MKYILSVCSCLLIVGCSSVNVQITTTNDWEGHYMTVQDFKDKTNDIKLNKNESVWVLSNTTLKNVLRNVK